MLQAVCALHVRFDRGRGNRGDQPYRPFFAPREANRAASSADGLVTFTGDAAQQEAAAGLWLLK